MTALAVAPPVRALIRKELREFRHHRMILLTATILPIAFLILPIGNLVLFEPETSIGGVKFAVGQATFDDLHSSCTRRHPFPVLRSQAS